MIGPEEFRKQWCDATLESLVAYPPECLSGVAVSDESRVFLTSIGLPESAAPFLGFYAPKNGDLQSVADVWRLAPDFNRYRIIGSNGSGDPLCIDESTGGQVVYLNHDFDFRRVPINSSIPQLAESLLTYRHVVRETQRLNGPDAFLDGDIPTELQNWLLRELIRIDPAAVQVDCFWSNELDCIRGNAA